MKVLIATNFYPPFDRGGSESVARESALALRDAGHEVVIVTAVPLQRWRSLWPASLIEDGMTVYRWFPLNLYYLARAARYPLPVRFVWTAIDLVNPFAALASWSVLRRERPDVIISHNLKGMGAFLPRLLRAASVRYVHVLHDVQLVEPNGLLYPPTLAARTSTPHVRAYATYMRWAFATVPIVVAPSKFLLNFYRDRNFFSAATCHVILNPVSSVPLKKEKHETINVIYVGHMEPHKGINIVLDAWETMDNPSMQLILVGDGTGTLRARGLAERDQRVHVKGRLTGKDLEEIWSVADLLVVPSICVENSPRVIAEAMARNVPVVATTVGGIPELAALWPGIHLVPPNHPEALRAGIETLVSLRSSDRIPAPPKMPDAAAYVSELLQLTSGSTPK